MYTPLKDDKPTRAGCVPVAVAQLMSFWSYPNSWNGYDFDWNSMKAETTVVKDPGAGMIARLMQQLGLSENLDATYGPYDDGTGADSKNIKRTLKNAGYSSPGSLANYNSGTVNGELKNGYPVLASGFAYKSGSSYSSGHQWLIEGLMDRIRPVYTYQNGLLYSTGFEVEQFVYCNMGWWGKADGYYYHGAFDTKSGPAITRTGEPYNFQYKIEMHTGVRK